MRTSGLVLALALLGALASAGCGDDGAAAPPPLTVTVTAEPTSEVADSATATGEAGTAGTPGPTDEGAGDPVGAPTAAADVTSVVEPPEGFDGYPAFRSPSGNISCVLHDPGVEDEGYVECRVDEAEWDHDRPEDCDIEWIGSAVSMGVAGPGAVGTCTGEPVAVTTTLEYGTAWRSDDLSCESQPDGVTCRSLRSGHAFRVSRGDYELSYAAPGTTDR